MPRFHPIYDTALTLLGIVNLVAGVRWLTVPTLDGLLILTGLVLLGIELSRVYTALWMLSVSLDDDPPGEEVVEETSERIECPRCEVVQFRRAA